MAQDLAASANTPRQRDVLSRPIVAAQAATATVRVEEGVARYAVRLARATRAARGLLIGAGPRGALSLVRAARGRALLLGRDFVAPDDIKMVAPPVLAHRLAGFESGGHQWAFVEEGLESVPTPR